MLLSLIFSQKSPSLNVGHFHTVTILSPPLVERIYPISKQCFVLNFAIITGRQEPIMMQQYLISIDARLRSRNSTLSVKAETAECLVARDSIIA